jgi:hypothetical protein
MNKFFSALVGFLTISSSCLAQTIEFPASGENQKATAIQQIGLVKCSITYSRPNVTSPTGEDRRGKIWGGVIPYGENVPFPWRAGANERTTIEFSHDVMLENTMITAGKYGVLFYIESDKPWTLILSKDHGGWGGFSYNKDNDAMRVQITPKECEYTEWLTYGFDAPTMKDASVYMKWETKEVRFSIQVPNAVQLYVDHFRGALKTAPVFFYSENWQWAADFCADHNVNLDEALNWANRSMAPGIGLETFSTLRTKARILEKLTRVEESDATMDKAVKSTTANAMLVDRYARELMTNKRSDRAFQILKLNEANFKDQRFITNLGLADYYASVNDKKNERKHLQIAIDNASDRQKAMAAKLKERM